MILVLCDAVLLRDNRSSLLHWREGNWDMEQAAYCTGERVTGIWNRQLTA